MRGQPSGPVFFSTSLSVIPPISVGQVWSPSPVVHPRGKQSGANSGAKMADDPDQEKRLTRLRHKYSLEYEMITAAAAFEHAALRPLYLLNGGGLLAFFTLYGAFSRTAGAAPPFNRSMMAWAIAAWVCGLLLAFATGAAAARSQFSFRKLRGTEAELAEKHLGLETDRSEAKLNQVIGAFTAAGRNARWLAIGTGVLSAAAFVGGILFAFASLPS